MPKVYTRAVISSSDTAAATQSQRAVLRSYYCLCGDFLLVMQGKLDRLPQRRTDGSYIIRSQASPKNQPARKFKLNAQPGTRVNIQRRGDSSGKIEQRQWLNCSRCSTNVAYQTTPPPAGSGPFVYILRGAMTELQGRIPLDAFEGEDELEDDKEGASESDRKGKAK